MSRLFHKISYSLHHWNEVGVSMQRKLTLYVACMVLFVFAAGVVVIQKAGIVPGSERNLGEALTVQHQNTVSAMTKQMDLLTARSISLSEEITRTMEQVLIESGKSFSDLNDDSELILDLEFTVWIAGGRFCVPMHAVSAFLYRCRRKCKGRMWLCENCISHENSTCIFGSENTSGQQISNPHIVVFPRGS